MLNYLVKLLRTEYDCPDITEHNLTLLRQGKYANAIVYRIQADEKVLVVKEFYSRSWIIRAIVGRILVFREIKALNALVGMPGIPDEVRRLGPYALVMKYVGDETIKLLCNTGRKLPKTFFQDLERRVDAMHHAGYVHLDLRNMGNIICDGDGQPQIIDFQTSLKTSHLPRIIRQFLEDVDRSGIYKNWSRLCEDKLDTEQIAFMEHFKGFRKLWIFDGYRLQRKMKRLRNRIKSRFGHS